MRIFGKTGCWTYLLAAALSLAITAQSQAQIMQQMMGGGGIREMGGMGGMQPGMQLGGMGGGMMGGGMMGQQMMGAGAAWAAA